MKEYEYKFVEVPIRGGLRVKPGDSFQDCKEVVLQGAREGWRLVQIVTPFNEKMGVAGAFCYQVVLEREKE